MSKITNEELENLANLGRNSYAFSGRETFPLEVQNNLIRNNAKFFILAVQLVPDIISELLERRGQDDHVSELDT